MQDLEGQIKVELPVHVDERISKAGQGCQTVSQFLGNRAIRCQKLEGLPVATRPLPAVGGQQMLADVDRGLDGRQHRVQDHVAGIALPQ